MILRVIDIEATLKNEIWLYGLIIIKKNMIKMLDLVEKEFVIIMKSWYYKINYILSY